MRYYLDTEFIDNGSTIDLISIGIVCEDGREYYAQASEFSNEDVSNWVKENVFPHLSVCSRDRPIRADWDNKGLPYTPNEFHFGIGNCRKADCPWRSHVELCNEIKHFFYGEKIELYGWCAAYDYVALCQLFGTMMDLPKGYPHYIHDLQQLLDERGIYDDQLPQQEGASHNALEDARHIKKLYEYVLGTGLEHERT